MAISRIQYITIAELNEILGTAYDECDEKLLLVYEASELMKYHMFNRTLDVTDYTVLTAPNNLKLAVAYQVKYLQDNPDDEYAGNSKSVSIGRTSETTGFGSSPSQEYRKICPKSQRYLIDGGLMRRIV